MPMPTGVESLCAVIRVAEVLAAFVKSDEMGAA